MYLQCTGSVHHPSPPVFGTILTATQRYNWGFKGIKRGSAVAPYPDPATIYRWLAISDPGDDMFEDIYMGDM
jgi:hypothetical protein